MDNNSSFYVDGSSYSEATVTTSDRQVYGNAGLVLPLMDALTAAVGLSNRWAREDHVHPTNFADTRAAAQATAFAAPITAIYLAGFYVSGDLGAGAVYTSIGATSTGPMAFQDALGRWFQLVIKSVANVGWFGAKGDYTTDDSTTIHTAVNAAYSANARVYFPTGGYRITQDAVLTQTVDQSARGMTYFGDGPKNSVLMLDATGAGSDLYFYNNGTTLNRARGNWYSDLTFTSTGYTFTTWADIPDRAKGFRIYGVGTDAEHTFTRCQFYALKNCFETAGTDGTDSLRFSQCKFNEIKNNVLLLQNAQSVCHTFIGTHIESIYGDIFRIDGSGGGGISVTGGSIIPLSNSGVNTYVINITGSAGQNDMPIVFSGVRVELRGNLTNLFNIPGSGGPYVPILSFVDSALLDQSGIAKPNWGNVHSYSSVNFTRCTFNENFVGAINFVVGDLQYRQAGRLIFESCAIPVDWSDRCTLNGSGWGGISARNCYGTNVGASFSGDHYAHDFDMHWNQTAGDYTTWSDGYLDPIGGDGSQTDNQLRLKTAQIKLPSENWPNNSIAQTLKLPRNALIKAIHVRKPPNVYGDTTVITYNVSRLDKTGTPHLTTNSAAQYLAHSGDVDNYFYHVGNTVNERTLALYPSVGTVNGNPRGGTAYVEYY